MFEWLRAMMASGPERPPAPEAEIFAVGDIHGRRDLLEKLVANIRDVAQTANPEIIFLGDYIDRGAESREVIDLLIGGDIQNRFKPVFLKGNHEATLLEFLDDARIGPSWVQYGGGETLMSYGVKPPEFKGDLEAWGAASQELRQRMPVAHLEFYLNLELCAERGCYLFVHAGVDPAKRLDAQGEAELLWIREAFLDDTRQLERIIVHGHTPAAEPYQDNRRIGLDLGGYQTGRLAAVRLHGSSISFITT